MERCCWSRKDDVPATQQQQRKSYDRSRVVGRESGGEQGRNAAGTGRVMFLRKLASSTAAKVEVESWAGSLVERKGELVLYHHHRGTLRR